MKSKDYRNNPLFLRNEYPITSDYGMPILGKANLLRFDGLMSYHDTRPNDARAKETSYLIHFFKDDYRFEFLYEKPYGPVGEARLKKLAQYTAVCTPDFSLYPEMPLPIQQAQIFKSRWCGAFWESMGLNVIPTVTWADERSFAFCFNGLPEHSIVAVSTTGCSEHKNPFMRGYNKL